MKNNPVESYRSLFEYRQILKKSGNRYFLTIFLLSLSSLLEGVALMSLVPTLKQAVDPAEKSFFHISVPLDLGLGCFVILGVISTLIKFLGKRKAVAIQGSVYAYLNKQMLERLANLNWVSFQSIKTGEIGKTLLNEASAISVGVLSALQAVGAAFAAATLIIFAMFFSWKFSLITLAFGALGFFFHNQVRARVISETRRLNESVSFLSQESSEFFWGLKLIKSSGLSGFSQLRIASLIDRFGNAMVRSTQFRHLSTFIIDSSAIVFVAIFLLTTLQFKMLSFVDAIVFLGIFYRIMPRLTEVFQNLQVASSHLVWHDSWLERESFAKTNTEEKTTKPANEFRNAITFSDVSYSYIERRSTLNNISFEIAKRESIAIVGRTGSGKTTMFDLLTGLLAPTAGKILIDGNDLASVNKDDWRTQLGIVTQSCPLFHGSIYDNVTWGEKNCDKVRVKECVEMIGARKFIADLPHGYDTDIGAMGGKISGGQRQLIALARAIYKDPPIILMDEPTSALDAMSENVFWKGVYKLYGTTTILIISHKVNYLNFVDRILVIRNGQISQSGKYNELLEDESGDFYMLAKQEPDVAS